MSGATSPVEGEAVKPARRRSSPPPWNNAVTVPVGWRLSALKGLQFERDLGPFLLRVIDASEATLRTDGYATYRSFEKIGVRHDRRVQGDPAQAGKILPWSHIVFGNLKNWLRGTFHGVSGKHLQRYLEEFVYRFDRRWREGEMFGFVLRRAVQGKPLSYGCLVTAEASG
jgi:hypothetical protein